MRSLGASWLLLLATCAGGCARGYPEKPAFNAAEYRPYSKPGTASITGQAYVQTADGMRYGSGDVVFLSPVTSYTTAWFERTIVNRQDFGDIDSRHGRYHKETVAGREGRFAFKGLAAGQYYVTCAIVWQGADGAERGHVVGEKITVSPGQLVDVKLSREPGLRSPN